MEGTLVVNGMILSSSDTGENDKRIVLLTRERGRVTAFANGARRPLSHLLSAVKVFSYGEFELFPGRNSNTLKKAEIKEFFPKITEDLDRIMTASFLSEVADYYSMENADETGRLKLLYRTFQAISSGKFSSRLIKNIYLVRTMVINGEYLSAFKEQLSDSQAVMSALQCAERNPIESLYSFALSEEAEAEFERVVTGLRKRFMDHNFKSESFILSP
ncbi:MAG: DNA repair protein RecO [Lachnospiraceae bacterium]|nr:DNA repair protein RecO [Lachnospiraceae bacterium]